MSLNGGLGDVTSTKNVRLGPANGASEALTAVPNATGDGFWVITYQFNSPNIHAYEFDGNGPKNGGAPAITVLPANNVIGYGTFNISSDLKRIVQMGGTTRAGTLRTFLIDGATGKLNLEFEWQMADLGGQGGYSADFSPNGSYVYAVRVNGPAGLYRYKLDGATDSAAVKASEELVARTSGEGGQVRRGPDGKMYVADGYEPTLGVVAAPDAATPSFAPTGFTLAAGTSSMFGLPQFVTGCPKPAELSLVKTASPATPGAAHPGDLLTYSFTVRNSGSVAVSGVQVTEGAFTGTGGTPVVSCPAHPDPLQPGESFTCEAPYRLTAADVDAGAVSNTAKATGADPRGNPVQTESTVRSAIDAAPALSLVKRVVGDAPAHAGDTVRYEFEATNTGNVSLSGVTVTEGAFTGTGTLSPVTCDTNALAAGQKALCAATYTLTQADVDAGRITNAATATGTAARGANPTADATVTTPVAPAPALTLVKTAGTEKITAAGQTVDYTFTITNHGNVTMHDVNAVEGEFTGTGALTPVTCQNTAVAPGAAVTCTARYTVTAADLHTMALANTATATAVTAQGVTVTAGPSTVTIPVDVPVTPTAPTATPAPGLAITGGDAVPLAIAAALAATALGSGALIVLHTRRRQRG